LQQDDDACIYDSHVLSIELPGWILDEKTEERINHMIYRGCIYIILEILEYRIEHLKIEYPESRIDHDHKNKPEILKHKHNTFKHFP